MLSQAANNTLLHRTLKIPGPVRMAYSLGEPMDSTLDRLYRASDNGDPLPWDDLTNAAQQFFDQNPENWAAHDRYFSNFGGLWQPAILAQAFPLAESIWENALQPATLWEQTHAGQTLHKGTAYYFWAMTALLNGDIDRGYLLTHQAVVEDARRSAEPTPDTPAYALVSLNYEKVDQAFHKWFLDLT
jgi:hypothetical protein